MIRFDGRRIQNEVSQHIGGLRNLPTNENELTLNMAAQKKHFLNQRICKRTKTHLKRKMNRIQLRQQQYQQTQLERMGNLR